MSAAGVPKKRLRLSQTGHDGMLEWAVDLHVPVGAHVTCVPSGPHLVVEEVEEDLLPQIADGGLTPAGGNNGSGDLSKQEPKQSEAEEDEDAEDEDASDTAAEDDLPQSRLPRNKPDFHLVKVMPQEGGSASSSSSAETNTATNKESDAYLRDLVSNATATTASLIMEEATKEVLLSSSRPLSDKGAVKGAPNASTYSYTYAGIPRVFCDRTLSRDNRSPSSPHTHHHDSCSSSPSKDWESHNWTHDDSPPASTPRQVAIVRTLESGSRPVITVPPRVTTSHRTAPATPTKRPWSQVKNNGSARRESNEIPVKPEGAKAIRRPAHSDAAPKSRVHFTRDGQVPMCRMPNCRRPMYFYKNEDRWRCNLNRGGCGAVFHNNEQDIGVCSKCQRSVEDQIPCYDWCVCRYCTSNKKLSGGTSEPAPTPTSDAAPPESSAKRAASQSGGSSTGDSPSLSAQSPDSPPTVDPPPLQSRPDDSSAETWKAA